MSTAKIAVKNPLVELTGDEMAQVMWDMVKDRIFLSKLDVKLETFDLSLRNRDVTHDRVTIDAAEAVMRSGVGLKCATITPSAAHAAELGLKRPWTSPNVTIRNMLGGTVFREPIMLPGLQPLVSTWRQPIVIARHAYGDLFMAEEMDCWGPGKVEMVFSAANGMEERRLLAELHGPGVVQGMHNTDKSIRSFVRACLNYALAEKRPLWFGSKETVSRIYHGRFSKIFAEEFAARKGEFEQAGLEFVSGSIDDIVVKIIKSGGGMVWACMNYDGDIFTDLLAAGFGSRSLMSSVLHNPGGAYLFETAHGTITRLYEKYRRGEPSSADPVATIYAWSNALTKRGELDGTPELLAFCQQVKQAVVETVEAGIMTKDMMSLSGVTDREPDTTEGFINSVAERLD